MKYQVLLPITALLVVVACSRTGGEQVPSNATTEATPASEAPAAAPAKPVAGQSESKHGAMDHDDGQEHGQSDHAQSAHDTGGHTDGNHGHGGHQYSFGQPGEAAAVSRTVNVTGDDDFKFQPASLMVKTGETIRFNVKNIGKLPHEFALGDEASQKKHAEMMKQMPDMVHADPNAVTVQPGEEKSLIWKFTQAGRIEFACHVPGHYEAGMKGVIEVAE